MIIINFFPQVLWIWHKILLITFCIHSSWLIYYHLTPGLINIPHHQCAILWRQSCTNFWKRLQQQHLNCISARQTPSLPPLGGLWWSTPACIKTTIRQHSWWSLMMNSRCSLISCLLGFGGTIMPAWPWWHRSLLTSLRDKEKRA